MGASPHTVVSCNKALIISPSRREPSYLFLFFFLFLPLCFSSTGRALTIKLEYSHPDGWFRWNVWFPLCHRSPTSQKHRHAFERRLTALSLYLSKIVYRIAMRIASEACRVNFILFYLMFYALRIALFFSSRYRDVVRLRVSTLSMGRSLCALPSGNLALVGNGN